MKKKNLVLYKQMFFLQQANLVAFFLLSSNSYVERKKFLSHLEFVLKCKVSSIGLTESFKKHFLGKYSFWLSGNILAVALPESMLDFDFLVKNEYFMLGFYFFLGFKYHNIYYKYDFGIIDNFFLKKNFIKTCGDVLLSLVFLNRNLIYGLSFFVHQIYNFIYAYVKSIVCRFSLWKKKTA